MFNFTVRQPVREGLATPAFEKLQTWNGYIALFMKWQFGDFLTSSLADIQKELHASIIPQMLLKATIEARDELFELSDSTNN